YGEGPRFRHVVFDSGHDYNRPMREAMYGWMTRWLTGTGGGDPIPEPKFVTESAEDLACFPDPARRPQPWVTPPVLAGRTAEALRKQADARRPTHAEEWQATAVGQRARLTQVLGGLPPVPRLAVQLGPTQRTDEVSVTPAYL